MKIAGKHHVPDKCPPECPHIEEYKRYDMGDPCRICPVFLCKTVIYEGETINILPPDQYPKKQAQRWENWFKRGMKGRISVKEE